MKTPLSTLFLAGSLVISGCENKSHQNKTEENIDTNKLIKYSLKVTALKLIEQGKELDSLNSLYDSLDKKSDTMIDSLRKNVKYK